MTPESEKGNRKSLITGLIVGGAVGSVLSLLFAPEKGEASRKKALGGTKKFLEKLKSLSKPSDDL